MNYHIRPMSVADAQAVCGWRYPGAYRFYDMDADPEDLREFLDYDGWKPRPLTHLVIRVGGSVVASMGTPHASLHSELCLHNGA